MKRIIKVIFGVIKWFLIASITLVLLFKWFPVKYTLQMVKNGIEYHDDKEYNRFQYWIPLVDVSTPFQEALVAKVDKDFYSHNGFRQGEIKDEVERLKNGDKKIQRCSTLSQEVANMVFTFNSSTWIRKGVEDWYTFLIEKIWGKKRILEVYLNIAEFGKGIYGIRAASNFYYNKDTSYLTDTELRHLLSHLQRPTSNCSQNIKR